MDVRSKQIIDGCESKGMEKSTLMFLQSVSLCVVREKDPKLLLWTFVGFGVMFYFSSVTCCIKANEMFAL